MHDAVTDWEDVENHVEAESARARAKERKVTEDQIKHMVDRFLMWKLPETFNPDGGINFTKVGNSGTDHEYVRNPVGTNLLSAVEATAMVRHMIEGMPDSTP